MQTIKINAEQRKTKRAFLRAVLAEGHNKDTVREYVDSAEHNEGYDYWTQFTAQELVHDFDTYLQYRD